MATVAEQLRTAREAAGLSIHEAAEVTKIKPDHLRALEQGEYSAFAAPVYIRGFVRTYARLLHLDAEIIATAVDAELRQSAQFQEPASSLPGHRGLLDLLMLQFSKVNWRVAFPTLGVVAALLVVIVGYRAWVNYRQRDPLAELGPGMHQPARPDPIETLPLPGPSPKR